MRSAGSGLAIRGSVPRGFGMLAYWLLGWPQ
jgi:hypothetical protein